MNLDISPSGKLSLQQKPQQRWFGDEPEIMQNCVIAGQVMMAIQKSDSEPEKYELYYLGFMSGDYMGIENAKDKAPEFARCVLQKMIGLIED